MFSTFSFSFLLLSNQTNQTAQILPGNSVKNLRYNEAYLALIGRKMPTNPLPSTELPPLWGTFHRSNNLNRDKLRGDLGTGTNPSTNTIPITNNPSPPPPQPSSTTTTDDLILGTTTPDENPDLSLLSLIDLEQAIEHVTELILNPSLLNSGRSGSSSALAGVHKCNNSHLLVDGKVQWKKALYFQNFPTSCRGALMKRSIR